MVLPLIQEKRSQRLMSDPDLPNVDELFDGAVLAKS